MILDYKGKRPNIGRNVFIAPTAVVVGDVQLGDHSSVWFGAVLRGDMAPVTVGKKTNIQDNCIVHVDAGHPVVIGDNVTVGHNAVVHGCTVEDNCLIGMSAVVLNDACIKKGSVVAAGSVVRERSVVGPGHLVAGVPAQLKKELPEASREDVPQSVLNYLDLAADYRGS